jgi:hypothetical protein
LLHAEVHQLDVVVMNMLVNNGRVCRGRVVDIDHVVYRVVAYVAGLVKHNVNRLAVLPSLDQAKVLHRWDNRHFGWPARTLAVSVILVVAPLTELFVAAGTNVYQDHGACQALSAWDGNVLMPTAQKRPANMNDTKSSCSNWLPAL